MELPCIISHLFLKTKLESFFLFVIYARDDSILSKNVVCTLQHRNVLILFENGASLGRS